MNCGPSRPAERLGHFHNRSLTSRVRPFISGTSSPVSYTHLDVYKRQVRGRCARASKAA